MPDSPRFPPKSPRAVEILAYPAVQLLDVAGPLQVFASANEVASRNGEAPLYAPRVVSAAAPVVTASAGLALMAAPPSSSRLLLSPTRCSMPLLRGYA
jgi:transcriptional regulator GlxA family with amidase domain